MLRLFMTALFLAIVIARQIGSSCTTPPCAANPTDVVAKTSVAFGKYPRGEEIYGPMEDGYTQQHSKFLDSLGCTSGKGHVPAGIDSYLSEQIIAKACDIKLPRQESGKHVGLLDDCGADTVENYFVNNFTCLYKWQGKHSTKVGEGIDAAKTPIYGKWEDYEQLMLPALDACGAHFGYTPESPTVEVYHHHVQDLAPFTVGCFGPSQSGGLVSLSVCRSLYPECGSSPTTVHTYAGEVKYDKFCPCFDAMGSNVGLVTTPQKWVYTELSDKSESCEAKGRRPITTKKECADALQSMNVVTTRDPWDVNDDTGAAGIRDGTHAGCNLRRQDSKNLVQMLFRVGTNIKGGSFNAVCKSKVE